jgi:hypothetical protein
MHRYDLNQSLTDPLLESEEFPLQTPTNYDEWKRSMGILNPTYSKSPCHYLTSSHQAQRESHKFLKLYPKPRHFSHYSMLGYESSNISTALDNSIQGLNNHLDQSLPLYSPSLDLSLTRGQNYPKFPKKSFKNPSKTFNMSSNNIPPNLRLQLSRPSPKYSNSPFSRKTRPMRGSKDQNFLYLDYIEGESKAGIESNGYWPNISGSNYNSVGTGQPFSNGNTLGGTGGFRVTMESGIRSRKRNFKKANIQDST